MSEIADVIAFLGGLVSDGPEAAVVEIGRQLGSD